MSEPCCCHLFCVGIVGVALLAAGRGYSEEATGAHLLGSIVAEPSYGVTDTCTRFSVEITVIK